jgi:hypothetical protein
MLKHIAWLLTGASSQELHDLFTRECCGQLRDQLSVS